MSGECNICGGEHAEGGCPNMDDYIAAGMHELLTSGLCSEAEAIDAKLTLQGEELERLRGLISPDGTQLERQARLVEIAREMGFNHAEEVWWDHDSSEWPLGDPTETAENGELGEVYQVDLGLTLGAAVFAVATHATAPDVYGTSLHDTRESAQAEAKDKVK